MADSINKLPDGIVMDILCRLSCKSIHQCKCVCKNWLALISTPCFVTHFMSLQSQNQNQPPPFALISQKLEVGNGRILVISEDSFFTTPLELSFLPCIQPDKIKIVKSSNDLLLCAAQEIFQSIYYICNPITKQWVSLPPALHRHEQVDVGFTCNPLYYETQDGRINSQYKYIVVRIPGLEDGTYVSAFNLEVFSSETGEWREDLIQCPPQLGIEKPMIMLSNPIVVTYNGMVYWWGGMCCYDLSNGESRYHFNPPLEMKMNNISWSGICRGLLRICQLRICQRMKKVRLIVWELKEEESGRVWNLEHDVGMDEMSKGEPSILEHVKGCQAWIDVAAIHPEDGDVVYLVLERDILACNLRRRSLDLCFKFSPQFKLPINYNYSLFPLVFRWWPTPVVP